MPSMRGMFWSVSTRLKSRVPAFSQASWPSTASTTLKPAFLRVNATFWRIEGESSTARIECIAFLRKVWKGLGAGAGTGKGSEQLDGTGVHLVLGDRVGSTRAI